MNSKIIGCGSYLPKEVVTNEQLESIVNTTNEWIMTRTGIYQRHIANQEETVAKMAYIASNNALLDAGITARNIELIINCTTSPDNTFPATATKLQSLLKIPNIPAFDVQAVCSGFIYGLQIADNFIKTGKYSTILLTCSEKMTKLINWQDRNTAVLFGDGAGAVVLTNEQNSNSGIIDSLIFADGNHHDLLYADSKAIHMRGREVFKYAIDKMAESIEKILIKNEMKISDINYLVPHQANLRIIKAISTKLNLPMSKIITCIEKHANCSAASIPLAFTELKTSGKLKKNDIVVFTAFGAGLTWGSAIIKW